MASVVLRNLARNPGVKNLSLECPDREFTVLLGPAGAGKTAILRLLAGLDAPDSGEILVGDRAVEKLPPVQRDLALMSHDAPLFPHLSVAANLTLPLELRRSTKDLIARRLKETAALLNLSDLLDRKPADLSALDRRRAELGRAFIQQPKAILLDDPLAGLEPVAVDHLRDDIAKLHHLSRATVIYATASSCEALTLGSRVALLRHGSVEQFGAPLDVYHQPASVFSAAALGSPGMNFLRGALKAPGGQLTFKESDGGSIELPLPPNEAAQAYVGRDVLLGIRPEDCVAVPAEAPNGPAIFQTLVDFVEIRGGETLFHAQTGAHAFISRSSVLVDPREAGRRGRFRLDPARAHLFDPATTRRIA